jgi:hypothetical protein
MRRIWPHEFNFIFENAEEVTLEVPHVRDADGASVATRKQALRVRLLQQDYERIWPFAETRFRLENRFAGKAVTMIVNNPLYHSWHPADGDTQVEGGNSAKPAATKHVVVHFLLDDVRQSAVV